MRLRCCYYCTINRLGNLDHRRSVALCFLCGIFSHVLFDHAHFAAVQSVTSHDILVFCGHSLVNLLLNKLALFSNCIHNYLVDEKVIHRNPYSKRTGFPAL